MSSTFIPFDNETVASEWRQKDALSNSTPPAAVFLQWVPARVIHTFPVRHTAGNATGEYTGCITAQPYVGRSMTMPTPSAYDNPSHIYAPLLRGQVDLPLVGDTVLTTTINEEQFYMGPININNNPNDTYDEKGPTLNLRLFNQNRNEQLTDMPGPAGFSPHLDVDSVFEKLKSTLSDDVLEAYSRRKAAEARGMNPNYVYRTQQQNLGKVPNKLMFPPGYANVEDPFNHYYFAYNPDMIFEGRMGNSIRIGSHYVNPYIFISNGRGDSTKEATGDGSLFTMSDRGMLNDLIGGRNIVDKKNIEGFPTQIQNFALSCDLKWDKYRTGLRGFGSSLYPFEEPEKTGIYDSLYSSPQVFLQSSKITFDSKDSHITLSAWEDILLGSGKDVRIHSEKQTIIDGSEVCIGQPKDVSTGEAIEMEPMVLGESLRLLLSDLIDALMDFSVAGIPQAMFSQGLNQSTISNLKGIADRLQPQKENSDGIMVPQTDILSKYHKIEKNIQDKDLKDTIESLKQEQEDSQQTE